MSTTNTIPYDEDEVLVRFAQTEQPDLSEWMQQYPAQARELAQMATERWSAGYTESVSDTVAVSRVREIGMATIRDRRGTVAGKVGITSLITVATARGLDIEAVAARLEVPYGLFVKLHRRLISLESIPQKFMETLCETLGRQRDEVVAYLSLPPTLGAQSSYFSPKKPVVREPEEFTVALSSDPEVTDSQKSRWLA